MHKPLKTVVASIDFMKIKNPVISASVLLVVMSLVVIIWQGFKFGIDFAGGLEVQLQFKDAMTTKTLRDVLAKNGFAGVSLQSFSANNEFLLRLDADGDLGKKTDSTNMAKSSQDSATAQDANSNKDQDAPDVGASPLQQDSRVKQLQEALASHFGSDTAFSIVRVDQVGPQIGSELKRNSLLAVFYSLILILIYIGLRFDYQYAPGAVFCLFHDAIITLGVFSVFGLEVNVQTMAAILTLIGYSLNDTIIVFDRIRENVEQFKGYSFVSVVNRSINDTLSRTILTSGTTMLAVLAMYFVAGGVIKDFAFALGLGIVIGTYSSIYVASPILIALDGFAQKS